MWGLCLSRMWSQSEALAYLNTHSCKCQRRPLPEPKRQFAFHPYRIVDIEYEKTPDYSYDFAVAGTDDDDSWYWQGALKSHNTKSLLTNASPGWHPPKAQRYIRRITFAKNDPVALACMDYGYSVVPGQSDKDDQGNLLNDPFDPRCNEWLVEIPVAVSWADIADEAGIDISRFNALAQFDFYMNVQRNYTTHNTPALIAAGKIYQKLHLQDPEHLNLSINSQTLNEQFQAFLAQQARAVGRVAAWQVVSASLDAIQDDLDGTPCLLILIDCDCATVCLGLVLQNSTCGGTRETGCVDPVLHRLFGGKHCAVFPAKHTDRTAMPGHHGVVSAIHDQYGKWSHGSLPSDVCGQVGNHRRNRCQFNSEFDA